MVVGSPKPAVTRQSHCRALSAPLSVGTENKENEATSFASQSQANLGEFTTITDIAQ